MGRLIYDLGIWVYSIVIYVVSPFNQKAKKFLKGRKNLFPHLSSKLKDNKKPVGDGMQQALEYSEILHIPFVFTSNGDSFVFHDKTTSTEKEISLDDFPSPNELWNKYLEHKGVDNLESKEIVEQDYYADTSGMTPRYYQQHAVNRTIEAISKG